MEPLTPPLASLKRLVRHFDFEDAETAPVEFPAGFKRNIAEDRGFPKFGSIRLTDETAASGRWSFGFELDGGSLSAQVPTGIIPILPLADYMVTVRVRTSGLRYARARLIASLFDAQGEVIAGSRTESRAVRTEGTWETLSAHVVGDAPDAVDLVVELQLVQPAHLAGGGGPPPRLEDVSGRAWFDDLNVWHVPRLELGTGSPTNVVTGPAPPSLRLLVRDLASEALTARLRVEDVNGDAVYGEAFPAPRGREPLAVEVPVSQSGWYHAELEVWNGEATVGRRGLDFVYLPDPPGAVRRRADRLAVVLPHVSADRLPVLPELARRLGVGGAVVDVWNERMSNELMDDRFARTRQMIEELLTTDLEVTFALEGVPHDIALSLGVDPDEVLELLSRDPDLWRAYLDEMLINFGLRVRRWQLGSTRPAGAFWKPDLAQLTADASASLARFVPEPTIVIPFSAEQEIPPLPAASGIDVTVPIEVRPEAIPDYVAPWRAGGRDVFIRFDLLPRETFTPRQRVLDLLLRALYGWRADVPRMAITAPWTWDADFGDRLSPDPAFAAWRGLAAAMGERRFAGELPIADGVHAWLMEGAEPGDDALVAFADIRPGDPPVTVRVVLADQAVRVLDPFGNTRDLEPADGGHLLAIGDMPLFVEGIDLSLARFRAGFTVEPDRVPATHRVHEGSLVLHNPWNIGISGSIRLLTAEDCEITPRRTEFVIRAGESVRLPVDLVFDRSAISGRKRIEAEVDLTADRDYRLHVQTTVDVGWDEVDLMGSWAMAQNAATGERELIITQTVTNRGQRTLNLDAFVLAPGLGQRRRSIAALAPGATTVRTFHIPGGGASLAGRTIRHGVAERDGLAQLSQVLEIPEFVGERD